MALDDIKLLAGKPQGNIHERIAPASFIREGPSPKCCFRLLFIWPIHKLSLFTWYYLTYRAILSPLVDLLPVNCSIQQASKHRPRSPDPNTQHHDQRKTVGPPSSKKVKRTETHPWPPKSHMLALLALKALSHPTTTSTTLSTLSPPTPGTFSFRTASSSIPTL